MAGSSVTLVHALGLDLVPGGHVAVGFRAGLVELLDPVFLRLALGERVLLAELVGDVGAHVVAGAALARRFLRGPAHDDGGVVFGVALRPHVQLLGAHGVGQQNVGVLGGVGHHGVPHQDELQLALVCQNVVRVVDVAVLVRDAVARVVPQELDVVVQLVGAHDAGVGGRHLLAVVHGVDPLVHRDGRLDGVLERQGSHEVGGRFGLALAGVRAGQADLADEHGQHADGARRVLAVRVALRAPALADERRLGGGDVGCQLLDALGRDAGDGGGPLGGLLHHVVAGAHDVVLVGLVLALGALGHGVLVVADAVLVQEALVHLVVRDPLVRDGGRQRGVGAGTDGQPLVRVSRARLVHAVVDVDDLAAAAGDGLAHLREVPHGVRAAHAGFRRAVAEHHHEVGGALGLGERGSVHVVVRAALAAVHEGQRHLQHVGGVVVRLVDVAAQQAQQAQTRLLAGGGVHAGGVVHVDGVVTVRVDDALQLAGDGVDGLVPADLLELALATLADALHGLRQAVGAVDPATHGAAAQAGARLQIDVAGVVGLHVDDLAVLGVPLEDAVAAAVDVALAPRDLVGRCARALACGALLVLRRAAVQRGRSGSAGKRQAGQRSLDERAARYARFVHGHGSLLLLRLFLSPVPQYRKQLAGESHSPCDLRTKPQVGVITIL